MDPITESFERELAEDLTLSQIETPFSDDSEMLQREAEEDGLYADNETMFEEQYENAEFAQDDDFHNMYADEDGFWSNQQEYD